MSRRGAALLSGLLVIALLMIFSLTIVNLASFHYRSVQHQQALLEAREAAQTGLSETVRRLSTDPTFTADIRGSIGSSSYSVSFQPGGAPWSSNNLGGFTAVPGWSGRSVPAHCALILARGQSRGGDQRTVEAVVHLEALPFPVESSGQISGTNVLVGGAASLAAYQTSGSTLKASVYSGSSEANSIQIQGTSQISGDVRTLGQAVLGPLVSVGGQVLNHSSSMTIPDLNISHFDNSGTPGVTVIASGNYDAVTNPVGGVPGLHRFTGSVYIDGPIHLTGPVQLNQASIFVANQGDFSVDAGALLGQGSMFVTGKTTFPAGSVLQNNSQIAVFSDKDLEISSGGFFQGVLYSHAKIKTGAGIKVMGAVIGKGGGGGRGDLDLATGGQIIHLPEYTSFASYWLARDGGAPMKLLYWGELP